LVVDDDPDVTVSAALAGSNSGAFWTGRKDEKLAKPTRRMRFEYIVDPGAADARASNYIEAAFRFRQYPLDSLKRLLAITPHFSEFLH
jgi:hypothetical protein